MFGLWERKKPIKINMLSTMRHDPYFVIDEKIKNSIISKYEKNNELYAMLGRKYRPDQDEFEYEGDIYYFCSDIDRWNDMRNKFKTIVDSYKDASLEEALNITLNAFKDIADK